MNTQHYIMQALKSEKEGFVGAVKEFIGYIIRLVLKVMTDAEILKNDDRGSWHKYADSLTPRMNYRDYIVNNASDYISNL